MKSEFKVGELVRLKNGNSPQKVVDIRKNLYRCEVEILCVYLSSLKHYENTLGEVYSEKWRRQEDFVHFVSAKVPETQVLDNGVWKPFQPEKTDMPDLYQLKNNLNRFGTALMVGDKPLRNSAGHIVLEMKGEGGKVEAFEESLIELVTPFTVKLHRLTVGDKANETQMDVIAEAGQAQKNDVLLELNSGHLWRVTALDTKCRSAKENRSKWIKLHTETIRFGANE